MTAPTAIVACDTVLEGKTQRHGVQREPNPPELSFGSTCTLCTLVPTPTLTKSKQNVLKKCVILGDQVSAETQQGLWNLWSWSYRSQLIGVLGATLAPMAALKARLATEPLI